MKKICKIVVLDAFPKQSKISNASNFSHILKRSEEEDATFSVLKLSK